MDTRSHFHFFDCSKAKFSNLNSLLDRFLDKRGASGFLIGISRKGFSGFLKGKFNANLLISLGFESSKLTLSSAAIALNKLKIRKDSSIITDCFTN